MNKHTIVKVENGTIINIKTNEEIPIELMSHHTVPKDGYYALSEVTCNGTCSIGSPSQNCVDNGFYVAKSCSLYKPKTLEEANIEMEDVLKLVGENKL